MHHGKYGVIKMKAIVLGANGFLGSSLVTNLLSHGVPVIGIARNEQKNQDILANPLYCHLKSDAEGLMALLNDSTLINFVSLKLDDSLTPNDYSIFTSKSNIVFYNTIWKGKNRLRDGTIRDQFKNISLTVNAVKFARKLNCCKFIHVSTQEEAFYQNYLDNWYCGDTPFPFSDLPYAAAKLVAKEMSMIEAYIDKIDFINTRFSVVLDSNLNSPSFIAKNLLKIKQRESYDKPLNKSPMEIIHINDLSEAYYYIGLYGKNKADYYIGQCCLHTIENFFRMASEIMNNGELSVQNYENLVDDDARKIYDNTSFINDTNFTFKYDIKSILEDAMR